METLSKNKIKWIHSLRLKKNRSAEKVFVVEGEKIVSEVIEEHSGLIELVATTSDSDLDYPEAYHIDPIDMKKISQFKTPSSCIAVVKIPEIEPLNSTLILAVDGVQDPGNLGTIIRTADWFGVDHIICSNDTVDSYNSKVVQSSMGSVFRTRIEYCDLCKRLPELNKPIYGALLNGKDLYSAPLKKEAILVVGNEGNGISEEIEAMVSNPVLIPKKGNAESLNVAIATGILLAEFTR